MAARHSWSSLVALFATALIAVPLAVSAPVDPIERCREEGLNQQVAAFEAGIERLAYRCAAKKPSRIAAAACIGQLRAELMNGIASERYRGKARRVLARFRDAFAHACAGADATPFTADDVTSESLDPGSSGGFRFHSWGADLLRRTRPALLTQLPHHPSFIGQLERIDANECFTREPVDVWLHKPGLERLQDTYQCLAVEEALASARAGLRVRSGQRIAFELVTPPITIDGGADRLPLGAPDGVNDTATTPWASGCPLPGVGRCAGDPRVNCVLQPGRGVDSQSADCPGASACVELATGPDGVTPADKPRTKIGEGRFFYRVEDLDPTHPGSEIEVACLIDGVRDGSGALVTTPPGGEKYICQVGERIGSNRDGVPACGGPCLVARLQGDGAAGCGTGGEATCIIASCVGGARAGQACGLGLGCLGGSCDGLGTPVVLTGDEAGFAMPRLGGEAYVLCPYEARLDLPVDVVAGAGWVVQDITAAPLFACRPAAVSVEVIAAHVHEPDAVGGDDALVLGLYAGTLRLQAGVTPCPTVSIPLPDAETGLGMRAGAGAIVAVGGIFPPSQRSGSSR